jgi:hypothetical protein
MKMFALIAAAMLSLIAPTPSNAHGQRDARLVVHSRAYHAPVVVIRRAPVVHHQRHALPVAHAHRHTVRPYVTYRTVRPHYPHHSRYPIARYHARPYRW